MEQKITNILPDVNIGLVVKDLAACQHFYEEVMGMEKVMEFPVSAEESQQMGYSNGLPFRIYLYKTVKQEYATRLKLIEFIDPAPIDAPIQVKPIPIPERPAQTGINDYAGVNYITFSYPSKADLEAATQKVKDAGLKVFGEISNSVFSGSYVKDPNGMFIELLYTP